MQGKRGGLNKMASPDFEEWLTREEEFFGLTGAVERTISPEKVRDMLLEELGYKPTEGQIEVMYRRGRERYEIMPMIGISTSTVTTYKGTIRERWDLWYRDIATGQRVVLSEVERRKAAIGL